MLTARAAVSTDAAARYAKQLLSHLGRTARVEAIEDQPDGGRLVFDYGVCAVVPYGKHLSLDASAADQESLDHVTDVVGRHLERFGARNELAVHWAPGGADPAG